MSQGDDLPQIYLVSPPTLDPDAFSGQLARILDTTEIACFRLSLATNAADDISRAADALRQTCHARDVAIVLSTHFRMVSDLGLDGCHLADGGRAMREVRKTLGSDAIIGAHCGSSRHTGLSAGEAGADYVAFGPIGESALGDGTVASPELFEWWSEMIEVPVVAEGGLTPQKAGALAHATDFIALGPELWDSPDPAQALSTFHAHIRGGS